MFILVQVACGLNHTLCVSVDGMSVWSFGDGDYGKLGLGNTLSKSLPTKIEALDSVNVKKVACGAQFSMALTKNGSVFTWGQGAIFIYYVLWNVYWIIECLD